jgi:hypothetical protein
VTNSSNLIWIFTCLGRTRFPRLILLCALSISLTARDLILAAAWQAIATRQPPAEPTINYRRPVREYRDVRIDDLRVAVGKQLQDEAPQVGKKALERLKALRTQVLNALPLKARKQLRRIPFFLMYGPEAKGGGRSNGLDYIQKDAPRYHPELDSRWGDAVVVYCAQNYIDISDLWARKALVHEFAHAYQLEHWPEHQPDIQSAWEHARDSGLYRNVHDIETGKTLERAYALVNQLEYFAELSAMYFATCNYQPSNRDRLKTYDPVGYAMIRELWAPRD